MKIGTNDATVLYSGLTPGSVSLYQINIKVPKLINRPPPPALAQAAKTNGATANVFSLPIEIDAGGSLSGSNAIGYFVAETDSQIGVSFVTSPPGLSIRVNDKAVVGNSGLLYFNPGTPFPIDVPNQLQFVGSNTGTRYRFAGWSQGGSVSQTLAPTVSTAFAAYFYTEHKLTTSTTQGATITSISPSSPDGYYLEGTQVSVAASCPAGQIPLGVIWTPLSTGGFGIPPFTLSPAVVTLNPYSVEVQFTCVQANATTVNTSPANVGLTVSVDGTTYTNSRTYDPSGATSHIHSTTSNQLVNGTQYAFTAWTPGTAALSQTVPSATGNVTYTAGFKISGYQVTATGCGVTVGPQSLAVAPNVFTPGVTLFATVNPPSGQALQSIAVTVGGVTTTYTSSPASFALTGPATITAACQQQVTACVNPPAGLAAWYSLDEPQSPSVDLITGEKANWIGGPASITGLVSKALSFNTGKYVDATNASEGDVGTGDFSIDAWVQSSPSSGVTTILDKRNLSTGVRGYSLYLFNGALGFQLADNSANSASCGTNASVSGCTNWGSSAQVADGKWHLVAATVSRSSNTGGKLYVDGNLVLTFDASIRPLSLSNSGKLRIGGGNGTDFVGSVDEVEIFNRVLTQAEIQTLVSAGSFGKCKPAQNVTLTVLTNPSGLMARIGASGAYSKAPVIAQVPVNQTQFVSVTDPQFDAATGTGYSFTGWSTGGSTATTTVQPASNFTATANFKVACYALTTSVSPSNSGIVTALPASGGLAGLPATCYAPGTTVTLTASGDAAKDYIFYGSWTGAGTGSTTRTVVMNGPSTVSANMNPYPAPNLPFGGSNWGYANGSTYQITGKLGNNGADYNGIQITQVVWTAAAGTGTITDSTTLPITIGNLAGGIGALSNTLTFTANMPTTVTQFKVCVSGTAVSPLSGKTVTWTDSQNCGHAFPRN